MYEEVGQLMVENDFLLCKWGLWNVRRAWNPGVRLKRVGAAVHDSRIALTSKQRPDCRWLTMIEKASRLLLRRQSEPLGFNRAGLYYQAVADNAYELKLMALIHRRYPVPPFYGSQRMTAWLQTQGHAINRKRLQHLMQQWACWRSTSVRTSASEH